LIYDLILRTRGDNLDLKRLNSRDCKPVESVVIKLLLEAKIEINKRASKIGN